MICLEEVFMQSNTNLKREVEKSSTRKVSCIGLEHPYDHPKIYLYIPEDKDEIECPYCSKLFKFSKSGKK